MFGRSKSSKVILCTSDIHCGSNDAIVSDSAYISASDDYHRATEREQVFCNFWKAIPDKLAKKRLDLVICNGEPINGPNRHENGMGNWSSDIEDQCNDYYKLMETFNYDNYLLTRGSGYHTTQIGYNVEETIARRMRALSCSGERDSEDTRLVGNFANISVNGVIVNITHHVGFSSRRGARLNALQVEMASMVYEAGKSYTENNSPKVYTRGHVHYWGEVRVGTTWGFITPCWKMPDNFNFKHGVAATTPDIGAVELIIESNQDIQVTPLMIQHEKIPKQKVIEV